MHCDEAKGKPSLIVRCKHPDDEDFLAQQGVGNGVRVGATKRQKAKVRVVAHMESEVSQLPLIVIEEGDTMFTPRNHCLLAKTAKVHAVIDAGVKVFRVSQAIALGMAGGFAHWITLVRMKRL